ncbi:GntR family transcriptional regulator [Litorilinea aerophila]|uniref:GntR family transcriptional regulator n=1 Tax=Litorilinea aerophila TaxID=1204385 RepID=UPI000B6C8745|nr:GntR family transcriptional regulator [Litorilinea aerophila]MCC9074992.1 GntR family transcriptional regulator [Litorilinea aerophila]OUC08614.1 hypothetical protein RY27_07945 [Litorilinea aerophila]
MSLASLLNHHNTANLQVDRNSLTGQATDLLREQIIGGRIPPGTKLIEREVAELLGISRMPAREALMNLEREGLVVAKNSGRYVIQPTQTDIEHLYQVRLLLECLAVELAASHATPEFCRALQANLQQMRDAIARNDRAAYVRSDLEAHQLIWAQAGNPHLQKMLHSITGPIFLFIATHTEFQTDWTETLQLHEELADAICAGNPKQAAQSMREQLENSLQLSLRVFRNPS